MLGYLCIGILTMTSTVYVNVKSNVVSSSMVNLGTFKSYKTGEELCRSFENRALSTQARTCECHPIAGE